MEGVNRYKSRVLAVKRKADAVADREDWIQSFSVIPDFDFSASDSRDASESVGLIPDSKPPEFVGNDE